MDPDAPQPSAPVEDPDNGRVIPPEAPDEDASITAPPIEPTQPAQQPLAQDVTMPEPDDDAAPVIVPTPVTPLPALQPDASQVPPQTAPQEPSDEDAAFVSESAPVAAPITPSNLEVTEPTAVSDTSVSPINPEITEYSTDHQTAPPGSRSDMKTLAILGLAKRRGNKADKLARILAFAEKKSHFTVRDVELHLLVPKRTAEEYLDELVTQGRLSRRGDVDSTEYWWEG